MLGETTKVELGDVHVGTVTWYSITEAGPAELVIRVTVRLEVARPLVINKADFIVPAKAAVESKLPAETEMISVMYWIPFTL
jgi:hypothetical protein